MIPSSYTPQDKAELADITNGTQQFQLQSPKQPLGSSSQHYLRTCVETYTSSSHSLIPIPTPPSRDAAMRLSTPSPSSIHHTTQEPSPFLSSTTRRRLQLSRENSPNTSTTTSIPSPLPSSSKKSTLTEESPIHVDENNFTQSSIYRNTSLFVVPEDIHTSSSKPSSSSFKPLTSLERRHGWIQSPRRHSESSLGIIFYQRHGYKDHTPPPPPPPSTLTTKTSIPPPHSPTIKKQRTSLNEATLIQWKEQHEEEEAKEKPTRKSTHSCPDLSLYLPIKDHCKHAGVNCISSQAFASLLKGNAIANDHIEKVFVIDCRYPYEFEGGHVFSGINLWQESQIKSFFHQNQVLGQHVAIIFHCEYSMDRGPTLCKYLRKLDREAHGLDGYPNLYYPHLFVLERGYRLFFQEFQHLCEPCGYTSMFDEAYADQLKTYQRHSKLSRRLSQQKTTL